MKKLLFLLSFSILFQSCYSYKSIDYSNIETDKKQKLEVLMLNKTIMKGQLVSKNEKTIILQTKDGQGAIPIEEVYNVKVKEFVLLKLKILCLDLLTSFLKYVFLDILYFLIV